MNGKMKVPRVQLLTVAGLLDGTQQAKHPEYDPDLNFKEAKRESSDEQGVFEMPPPYGKAEGADEQGKLL